MGTVYTYTEGQLPATCTIGKKSLKYFIYHKPLMSLSSIFQQENKGTK